MKAIMTSAAILCLSAAGALADPTKDVTVTWAGSQAPVPGGSEHFTGEVQVLSRMKGTEPARIGGGVVQFEKGGRTAWHTHPLGQTLIVTEAEGRVQQWGGPVQVIKVGDIVWIPPGVKHWHGAAPNSPMTHIAFSEALDGKTVEWMEKVSDDQYRE